MTKRIFNSILAVAVSVLLMCFAVIMDALYQAFSAEQRSELAVELSIAAHGVEAAGEEWLRTLKVPNYRLTLISPDGAVRYDSVADAASMENHLSREEISEAMETGTGEGERISATLTDKTLYRAVRLENGDVLRISVTRNSLLTLLLGMMTPITVVLIASIIISAFLAKAVAKRATEPLNSLDLEHPLDNGAYEELSPLLLRISHQQGEIERQMKELRRKRDEFAIITGSMNEGLILLNENGAVVSMNPAAERLFGSLLHGEDGRIPAQEDDEDIRSAVEAAMTLGRSSAHIERGGRQYEVDASRIDLDGRAAGAAVLIFDVTDKALSEQRRREFTANVSHELKTPLQSIMGSAELIENGLVKPADMPRFIGNIRTEAARLVTLIDDIIRLSELDEGTEPPRDEVELHALADEAAAALSDAAKKKNIAVSVSGEARATGVRRLLYEIIYNLVDNAIKYNTPGGSVTVSLSSEGSSCAIAVADTGIGIPAAERERVFERFYRVDKSHSKASGGTGLGLSIVKHAVMAHGGTVSLESEAGRGTLVTVTLPR